MSGICEHSYMCQWTNQAHISSHAFRKKNVSHGTVIPSFTHSSKKVMLCLCSKSLFSQLAASTGEREHILQTSMRNTLTKQTTNTVRRYRNADNVSLFCSPLPSQSSTICHYLSFCLGHYLLFYLNVQMFPMGGDGERKILSTFLVDSLQGYRTLSLPPSITQAHLCLSLSLFDFLYFSFCPSSSFHQNFTKRELCGLLCAGGKGALD